MISQIAFNLYTNKTEELSKISDTSQKMITTYYIIY